MESIGENLELIWDWGVLKLSELAEFMGEALQGLDLNWEWYTLVVRLVFPVLAIIIAWRCILPLLWSSRHSVIWGYLTLKDGTRIPLNHWENSIGRSNSSDVVLNYPFISRNHAVLIFRRGNVFIYDLGSKNGVEVNGKKVDNFAPVESGDEVSIGGLKTTAKLKQEPSTRASRTAPKDFIKKYAAAGKWIKPELTFFLILIFQVLSAFQVWLATGFDLESGILQAFILFILAECAFFVFLYGRTKKHVELELLCLFLSGLSLLVIASGAPAALFVQTISIIVGMGVYAGVIYAIEDLQRADKLKKVFMGIALVLLVLTLAIGEIHFGAQRWIDLGIISFQPSEFVKIAFVLSGAATLDRLLTTRNMTAFIGFAGICIVSFVLMRDLGTVVVFFGAFMVIAFMRSGDWRTIALASSGALFGVIAASFLMPYVASRFAVWGNVWDHAFSMGYQQTQTMIAVASGGLLGTGGGNGNLSYVPAADTDLVFGVLSEEWGLLLAVVSILIIAFCGVYSLLLTQNTRSSFYAIAACGAASIILIQTALNVLGSVDLLPLTGITVPFISRGGSSMIASWGLLALIKSADNRFRG